LNLFQEWLSHGGDWKKVSLVYERLTKESRSFKKGRKGMKERDILAAYGPESFGFYEFM